jgi:glycerol-3-phosphate dehydrogenase
MRISFLNVEAAQEALPQIIEILTQELKWSKSEAKAQTEMATTFLKTEMGLGINKESVISSEIELTKDEINKYTKQFSALDQERKGYIGVNDLRRSLKATGQTITDVELHGMLSEVDINKNGQVELDEYLELMSAIKTGAVSTNRLATIAALEYNKELMKISVDRSGGGL